MSYSQTDFGWDGQVYTASIEPVTITGSSEIMVTYNCGCIEEGFMCLVSASGKSESDTIQNYIYTSVANHNYTEVSFGWLQTYGYNTLLYSVENVTPGDYYLCWLGRSDNTHPRIRNETFDGDSFNLLVDQIIAHENGTLTFRFMNDIKIVK